MRRVARVCFSTLELCLRYYMYSIFCYRFVFFFASLGNFYKTEFFQRDNYLALASTRRSLVSHVEDLYLARKGLRRSLKSYFIEHGSAQSSSPSNYLKAVRPIEAILESALHSLGRCVDLVRPAGLFLHIVPKKDWEKALNALEHSISEIRNACDPDRPLSQTEWRKFFDRED